MYALVIPIDVVVNDEYRLGVYWRRATTGWFR